MSEEETMKREYAFLTRVGFSYCSLVDGWKSDIDSRPCKCWESQFAKNDAPCFDHLIDDEKYDTTSDVIKRLTEEVKPF